MNGPCPCIRFLKSRALILAAGLFALVGALIFVGGAWSASRSDGSAGAREVRSGGACDDTSCEKVHALFRRKASEEGQTLPCREASCPAFPGRVAPAPAASGIQ
jgi:hypothetical protein